MLDYVSKQNLITPANEVQEIYILTNHGRTLAEASILHVTYLSFMAFSLQLLDGHLDSLLRASWSRGACSNGTRRCGVAYQQPTGSVKVSTTTSDNSLGTRFFSFSIQTIAFGPPEAPSLVNSSMKSHK